MATIRNVTDGPKLVNAIPPFVLQAGEERENVELSDAELTTAQGTGWYEFAASLDGLDDNRDLIRAAIDGLDSKNDDHWTNAGLPEVAAVKVALGADVTRAQITAAAPEAKRPAA